MESLLQLFFTALFMPFFMAMQIAGPTPLPAPTPSPTATPQVLAVANDSLTDRVNVVRAANGCETPLTTNSQLNLAAQERAQYVSDGHWTHDGVWETMKKYYRYQIAGENLARQFNSDEAIVNAWLNSPAHREVMLNCRYTEVGVGRYNGYVSQLYGKR